jgi:hypothetical protein
VIGLALHAGAYVGGNAFLAFAPFDAAPLLPLAAWGIALGLHALLVSLSPSR